MIPLPKWAMANPIPCVYDLESGSAIEMTAKLYNTMAALVDEYNKFADGVNEAVGGFTEDEKESRAAFEEKIVKLCRQFQCQMEEYLMVNLDESAERILRELIKAGEIKVTEAQLKLDYDAATESLNITVEGDVEVG